MYFSNPLNLYELKRRTIIKVYWMSSFQDTYSTELALNISCWEISE